MIMLNNKDNARAKLPLLLPIKHFNKYKFAIY